MAVALYKNANPAQSTASKRPSEQHSANGSAFP
jgi:hypothetical protein